jgi:hypothetical protein
VVHLGSAEDVVIVHGVVVDLGHPDGVPSVVAALADKYAQPGDAAYLPSGDPSFDVLYALRPTSAITWQLSGLRRIAASVAQRLGSQAGIVAELAWAGAVLAGCLEQAPPPGPQARLKRPASSPTHRVDRSSHSDAPGVPLKGW